MNRRRIRCRRCGHCFVLEVLSREEAIDRRIPTRPLQSQRCKSLDIELE